MHQRGVINYTKDLQKGKYGQIIRPADKVTVTGDFQGLVNNPISIQKVIDHLSKVGGISGMTVHKSIAKHVSAAYSSFK
jgi:hypothetical protein